MKTPSAWSSLPRWSRPLYVVSHPALLLPIALAGIFVFGSYSPAAITQAKLPLFLQGSTDYGDSNIFAVTIALYVIFGVLGAWHLALRLSASARTASALQGYLAALWILKVHVALFVVFGVLTWREDRRITPNDFRNMFLLAALLYAASVWLVVWLSRRSTRLPLKLLVAPAFIYLWLVVGSDGNTAKAGQERYSGEDPQWRPRGVRHAIMLQWHRACDRLLGDI
jgi:hypothetical protein